MQKKKKQTCQVKIFFITVLSMSYNFLKSQSSYLHHIANVNIINILMDMKVM